MAFTARVAVLNATILYSRGSVFWCRACHDLAYASQSEDESTVRCAPPARSSASWVATPTCWARLPPKPKACGSGPTSACGGATWRPSSGLMKHSTNGP